MKRVLLGPHAVTEALRAQPRQLAVVYVAGESTKAAQALRRACERARVRLEPKPRTELDLLAKGLRHQGVVAIAGDYSYLAFPELLERAGPRPLFVALDQVTDPHNFGAIVRSAVAMGADGLITLKDRAAPVTAAVVRSAAGATEAARIARVTNLARCLAQLREAGLQVVGLAGEADQLLAELPYPAGHGRTLVIGAEGAGLRRLTRERCDVLARIPLPGPVQSLNASVAAGIAIYESAKQRDAGAHARPSGRVSAKEA